MCSLKILVGFGNLAIDHFRVIQMDSRTMDIKNFANIFHNGVTIRALETLQSTVNSFRCNNSKDRKFNLMSII